MVPDFTAKSWQTSSHILSGSEKPFEKPEASPEIHGRSMRRFRGDYRTPKTALVFSRITAHRNPPPARDVLLLGVSRPP